MVGWILLVILGLIVLAFFVPVRVRVDYMDTWRVTARLFGMIPVWSFPSDKKTKDKPASTPVPSETPAKEAVKKPSVMDDVKALFREDGIGGVVRFFGKLAALLKTALASLARFITIRRLALCVRVGGEEADEAAVRYGQLSAALSASLTVLSKLVRIKNPTIRVIPDFTCEQTQVRMRMIVWVWPFGIVGAGIAALCKFLMIWIKTMKTSPDGVRHTTMQPKSE